MDDVGSVVTNGVIDLLHSTTGSGNDGMEEFIYEYVTYTHKWLDIVPVAFISNQASSCLKTAL